MKEVTRLAKIIASLKEALLHRSFEAGKFLIELEKEIRPGFGPFRTSVNIEHNGNPEEVHRGFHELIAGNASESTKGVEQTILFPRSRLNRTL